MSSKDKENKWLQDKLKQYFKFKSGSAMPPRVDFALTPECERELSADTPIHRRIKAIKELSDKVLSNRLEDKGLERLWKALVDLLQPDAPREYRMTALTFHKYLIQGQYEQLHMMRSIYFRYICDYNLYDEGQQRLELLQCLTENGKDIKYFEDKIGHFMLEWMPQIQNNSLIKDFLGVIVNLVKYNAAYLDEDIVSGIVNNCCHLCCYSGVSEVVLACLEVLETVVSYSIFPHDALYTFVCALCRSVNIEQYCQSSWKIMRNLLGTDLGHAALLEMVGVLVSGANDAGLTRGAVFYINMALWGAKRVNALKVTYTSVLPAFLSALDGDQSAVTYEVLLALQSLITRHGSELHDAAWDIIFIIIKRIIQQIDGVLPPNELISSHLQETITSIEQLHERRLYNGDLNQMYELIDICGHSRPEASTVKLINYRASLTGPIHNDWLGQLALLAERYCRQEARLSVRTHLLNAVHKIIQLYRDSYEEELLERVMMPTLQHCAIDSETAMRCTTARLLTDLALHCQSKCCSDMMDLLEKILNRQIEMYVTDVSLAPETDVSDAHAALDGLLKVFHAKLFRPPGTLAVKVYLVLVRHLELHYQRPWVFNHHPMIRWKIFEFLLSARANSYCYIGFCYDAAGNPVVGAAALQVKPVFSPFVCVEGGTPLSTDGSMKPVGSHSPITVHQQMVSYVSIRKACKLLIVCLTKERDWTVLQAVLREIPHVMQNKPLVPCKQKNCSEADQNPNKNIDVLAATLCQMVADKSLNLPECLRVPPGTKLGISEFHGAVLPVLGSLAPYHANLEPQTQQKIVRCLVKFGLVLRAPQQCISALTIFTLETRDTMVKLLPEVLLDLSKISDTTFIAGPILEFLSTLTRLPKVFASFVADQYMSVFAILLPYTNPSRYNHYVVSLAHHVIAAWFLKCRLSYRRDFVKFIIHGLHNYIIIPFEEARFKRNEFSVSLNEDSSTRKRGSSLGSKGTKISRESSSRSSFEPRRPLASASAAFHLELTETCVDLMARYTFSPCSAKPRRGATAEFLFSGGQSTTWLVGHKLVTITTSGCLQNSLRHGLCDRCLVLCKQHVESVQSPNPDSTEQKSDQASSEIKRQNSSENNKSGSSETQPPSPKIMSQEPDTQAQLTLKLDNLKQSRSEEGARGAAYSRVEEFLDGRGGCPCWCAGWAEVLVRHPTGDVSWVMRMQNQMNFDYRLESPLHDIAGLLAPSLQGPVPGAHPHAPPSSSTSSGLGDSRNDILSESEPGSRGGSSSSQHKATQCSSAQDLHKSSSDSVVATPSERRPPHASTFCIVPTAPPTRSHVGTEPINIPGSPQRQSSSSTTTTEEDDTMIPLSEQSKSRHPVRRSNSSPEMSSSWKNAFVARAEAGESIEGTDVEPESSEQLPLPPMTPLSTENMIVFEPTSGTHHHGKKGGKKADMRVSCEAIPEEMSGSGSTPPHHPHLMTYKSDPGSVIAGGEKVSTAGATAPPPGIAGGASDTALDALTTNLREIALQKVSSDGSVRAFESQFKVMSKPPASPSPASPRLAPRTTALSKPAVKLTALASDRDDLPPLSGSKRSNTISVMSPTRRRRENPSPKQRETRGLGGGGVTPAFVLLQLYHNMGVGSANTHNLAAAVSGGNASNPWMERPMLVSGDQHERTIKNLDRMPPLETYKVGVLYVGPGQQEDETRILKNEYGSIRYAEFLRDLGSLIAVDEAEKLGLFLNLEKGGRDGHFAYVWQDDIMQVQFHVATLMPNTASDPNANEKRKHIGNDFVSIVYNDSGADFNIHTIKGQFNFCIVVIEPLEHGINRVTVKTKDERIQKRFLTQTESKVISDQNVALLARQMALHCNLASLISRSLNDSDGMPYASNSLSRLRTIKRLRERLAAERASGESAPYAPPHGDLSRRVAMDDFTEYT